MENSYKVVYYDYNQTPAFQIAITDNLEKYKKFHARVYPVNYEPKNNEGYGKEQLIDSW